MSTEEETKKFVTPKERLTAKLNSITKESRNLKILHDHFGKENLEKLPFNSVDFKFAEKSWDGTWVAYVNLKTGKIKTQCTVADGEDELLQEGHYFLDHIEKEIFKKLDENS